MNMELNIRNEENKEFFDEKASGYDEVQQPDKESYKLFKARK